MSFKRNNDLYLLIEADLKGMIREMLGNQADKIESEKGFYDLGLDSAQLLDFVKILEVKIGENLYPTLLFEYSNVKELATYFVENWEGRYPVATPSVIQSELLVDEERNFEKEHVDKAAASQSSQSDQPPEQDAIAIIGMAGRYPQSPTFSTFWEKIIKGESAIEEVPPDHWQIEGYFSPGQLKQNFTYSKWGGFINGVDEFDPLFFSISPREAESMDPQLRLLLEIAWATLEDGGYTPERLNTATVGVYIGVMNDDYTWVTAEAYFKSGQFNSPGNYAHELANRISFFMNFQGPSITVETACSSSLTAIHMARKAILSGECDIAIAGGVNLSLHRSKYFVLSQTSIISSDGKEKTFDKEANGYVPSEGVGLVMLKSLKRAESDGDHIYGVIKESAINHSGTGGGKYIPNVKALARVMEKAIEKAAIDPEEITFIETHGAGTSLGDPVEIRGLTAAMEKSTHRKQFCALGSKANFGHMESASGVCSLTKMLLSMKAEQIPPCANVSTINPLIEIEKSPFYIPMSAKRWEVPEGKKRIGAINSFGLGGSNCFMIVEEYSQREKSGEKESSQELVVLSAQTLEQLKEYARELKEWLPGPASLKEIAYTLQIGRKAMEERLAIVAVNKEDLAQKLQGYLQGSTAEIFVGNSQQMGDVKLDFEGDLDEIVAQWESKGNLPQIAKMWVSGVLIDWKALHHKEKIHKVSLPTYPFAKEKYWIPQIPESNPVPLPAWHIDKPQPPLKKGQLLMLYPVWREKAINPTAQAKEIATLVFEFTSRSFEEVSLQLFDEVQKIVKSKSKEELLIQVVIHDPLQFGLAALLKTARLENPKIFGQVIYIDKGDCHLDENLKESRFALEDQEISYQNQKRLVKTWEELQQLPSHTHCPWKERGIYLITGGAGGLGLIFAKEIASKVRGATIILTGRSKLTNETLQKLQEICSLGCTIDYRQVGTGENQSISEVVTAIQRKYGTINGILHCAGVIKDNVLLKKTKEEFKEVLYPKVSETIALDAATSAFALDFFVLFSSLTAAFGNVGQADYAAANSFMDAFAVARNMQVAKGERHGRTLSLNWPLWREGGMQVGSYYEKAMQEKTGMIPLETETALEAFQAALALDDAELLIMEGDLKKMRSAFFSLLQNQKGELPMEQIKAKTNSAESRILESDISEYLKCVIASALKLSPSRISVKENLEKYGVDSIISIQLTKELQKTFTTIPDTLFFEYHCIEDVAKYISERHGEQLVPNFATEAQPEQQIIPKASVVATASAPAIQFQEPLPVSAQENAPKTEFVFKKSIPKDYSLQYLRGASSVVVKTPSHRTVEYIIGGEGPPILIFVPGGTLPTAYLNQYNFLRKFRRVVLVCPPGIGSSPIYQEDDSYNDVIKNCYESLRVIFPEQQSWTTIGWCMGGAFSLEFATTYPQNVKSMILISPFAYCVEWEPIHELKESEEFLGLHQDRSFEKFEEIEIVDPKEVRFYYTSTLEDVWDVRPKLKNISCPVDIISGSADCFTTPEEGQEIANLIKGARHHILNGRHWLPITNKNGVNRIIKSHLDSL